MVKLPTRRYRKPVREAPESQKEVPAYKPVTAADLAEIIKRVNARNATKEGA